MKVVYILLIILFVAVKAPAQTHLDESLVMKIRFESRDVTYDYTMDELTKIAPNQLSTPLPWRKEKRAYQGVYLEDLLKHHEPSLNIRCIEIVSANGYKATFTQDSLANTHFFLAYQDEGQPIPIRQKGPVIVIRDLNNLNDQAMRNLSLAYHLVWFANEIVVFEE
ncbi:hypothetical protein ACED25_02090 [Vibrio sp. 1F263]|uniref:hypothetical protein n=1 Tax=Vibrio sp. 1F263 TaxID=3230012 RepID=UPI00352C005E